jgi:hypothetical protein
MCIATVSLLLLLLLPALSLATRGAVVFVVVVIEEDEDGPYFKQAYLFCSDTCLSCKAFFLCFSSKLSLFDADDE